MNQVAVITDIHSNLPALQAALARIDSLGIEEIHCGGDLVGHGPHPNEVCALIQERDIPTIYGNYDYAVARSLDGCSCAYVTPHDRELGQRSVKWTLEHTDQEAKDFMLKLPFEMHFPLGSQDVHLVHDSPRKVNEYLFEDKPASLYERRRRSMTGRWSSAIPTSLGFASTVVSWCHEPEVSKCQEPAGARKTCSAPTTPMYLSSRTRQRRTPVCSKQFARSVPN